MTFYRNICYRKFNSKRKFGVELEASNTVKKSKVRQIIRDCSEHPVLTTKFSLSLNNNYWHVKDDSTCGPVGKGGPKGVEVASFIASGIGDLQHIAEVADTLRAAKVQTNQHCGLHIHADVSDLEFHQVMAICAYWIKVEFIIGLALPPHRIGNPYCYPIWRRYPIDCHENPTPMELWDNIEPNDLGIFENEDRRVTLNLVNYARALAYDSKNRCTIELRWPEGTFDGSVVKNWVRLFLNFIENCKNRPMPDNLYCPNITDALAILGLHHQKNNFVILSPGLFETKNWFLNRLLQYIPGHPTLKGNDVGRQFYLNEATALLDKMWGKYRNIA